MLHVELQLAARPHAEYGPKARVEVFENHKNRGTRQNPATARYLVEIGGFSDVCGNHGVVLIPFPDTVHLNRSP